MRQLPDLASFRRDLAVQVGGLAADLIVGDGHASPAGARDIVIAIQSAFDALVLGIYWPDEAPDADERFRPLSGALAQTTITRTFAEVERAIATATRVLVGAPRSRRGSSHEA